jgi:hypothetical protein
MSLVKVFEIGYENVPNDSDDLYSSTIRKPTLSEVWINADHVATVGSLDLPKSTTDELPKDLKWQVSGFSRVVFSTSAASGREIVVVGDPQSISTTINTAQS